MVGKKINKFSKPETKKCINTNKTLLMYELRKQVETKQKKNLIEQEK